MSRGPTRNERRWLRMVQAYNRQRAYERRVGVAALDPREMLSRDERERRNVDYASYGLRGRA